MAITFEFEGDSYTLEFSRKSITMMERNGFVIDDVPNKPMTMLPRLFAGSFIMHHPRIKEETINTIYKAMGDKEGLTEALIELYNEPINAMFDEPKDSEKKVVWKKG